jgi:RNA-directed DNA polymerase
MLFGSLPVFGDFKSCVTQDGLAAAFGTTRKQLEFHLYSPNAPQYTTFVIPKASGSDRLISVPPPYLMIWQTAFSKYLRDTYAPKLSVHGFVRDRSICTNAKQHIHRRLILNLDIKDFFPSIHYGRVRGLFGGYPFYFPHAVASTLARLCTNESKLPQGAPTSPVISNLICRRLDNSLWNLAKPGRCIYTRYADDMTFSTNHDFFPTTIVERYDDVLRHVELGKGLTKAIQDNNFAINHEKVRVRNSGQKQEVTGLTVNERLNVDRNFILSLRTILSDWRQLGEIKANAKFQSIDAERSTRASAPPSLRQHLRGKLEFLRMVRGQGDKVYMKYAISARRQNQGILAPPVVCGASADVLTFVRETLWIITGYDELNYSFPMGTAFSLKSVGVVSAQHVFNDLKGIMKVTLMRASPPFDEFQIDSYTSPPDLDLTVLASVASSHGTLRIADKPCKYGDAVALVGFPNWNSTADEPAMLQTSINQMKAISGTTYAGVNLSILSGASGGPVLDGNGEVIGVIANSPDHKLMLSASFKPVISNLSDGAGFVFTKAL